jgi:hypothetical protein
VTAADDRVPLEAARGRERSPAKAEEGSPASNSGRAASIEIAHPRIAHLDVAVTVAGCTIVVTIAIAAVVLRNSVRLVVWLGVVSAVMCAVGDGASRRCRERPRCEYRHGERE